MSESIEISDSLITDARAQSDSRQRSISEQIEFWARLGKVVEPLLFAGQSSPDVANPALEDVLKGVDANEGRSRLQQYLQHRAFPHYEPTDKADVFLRIEKDGSKVRGSFQDGEFIAAELTEQSNGKSKS